METDSFTVQSKVTPDTNKEVTEGKFSALLLTAIALLAVGNIICDTLTNFKCQFAFGLLINSLFLALYKIFYGAEKYIPLAGICIILFLYLYLSYLAYKGHIYAPVIGTIAYFIDMNLFWFTTKLTGILFHSVFLLLLIVSIVILKNQRKARELKQTSNG
jgi:hypothetical protein